MAVLWGGGAPKQTQAQSCASWGEVNRPPGHREGKAAGVGSRKQP